MSSYPNEIFPTPERSIDDEEFWNACNQEKLVLQYCEECESWMHPPIPLCPSCQSNQTSWREVPGHGEIFSYTTSYYDAGPGYQEHSPYTIIAVRLSDADDTIMISHLVNCDPEKAEIGMPVTVTWEEIDEDITLPLFEPLNQ